MEDTKINFNNDDNSMFGSNVEIPDSGSEFEIDTDSVIKNLKDSVEEKDIETPVFEQDETQSIDTKEVDTTKEDSLSDSNNSIEQWEEENDEDYVVKKYIVYVSRDYVPYIDNLSLDERSAYINDALELKINSENAKKCLQKRRKMLLHLIVAFIVFCLTMPIALFVAHKAIMATFDNYKYSQDNFEKLYRQKFEKDRAYMRSVQYNKMLESKKTAK